MFSIEWTGYLYTGTGATGTWTFSTKSDDNSYLWLGPTATTGYTVANAVVNNGGLYGMNIQTGSVALTTMTYYPIRILYGNAGGQYGIITSFTPPGGAATINGTGYYFSINNSRTTFTPTTLGFLAGATSNLQTQITNIALTPGAKGDPGAPGTNGTNGTAILPLANTWTNDNIFSNKIVTSFGIRDNSSGFNSSSFVAIANQDPNNNNLYKYYIPYLAYGLYLVSFGVSTDAKTFGSWYAQYTADAITSSPIIVGLYAAIHTGFAVRLIEVSYTMANDPLTAKFTLLRLISYPGN